MSEINCLIVDDSRISRMMLEKILQTIHPEWVMHHAENGQQAIDKADKEDFQIIFLDFNMPVMNGGEAARLLRTKFPDTRIALLTANVQDAIRTLAAELKIDFIPKPITLDKIELYVNR
jgi:two-component system, chemotaxis family, chemotaxis protein CheY